MSYTQLFVHIIFGTYRRQNTLKGDNYIKLIRYFNGVLTNKKCVPYEINGTENHIHFLVSMHPTINMSDLVKDLKLSSSTYIKKQVLFEYFDGWQSKYGAFNLSYDRVNVVQNYIKRQREHHKKLTFEEEFISFLKKAGIKYNPDYLFE